jgi:hypothetical protein
MPTTANDATVPVASTAAIGTMTVGGAATINAAATTVANTIFDVDVRIDGRCESRCPAGGGGRDILCGKKCMYMVVLLMLV